MINKKSKNLNKINQKNRLALFMSKRKTPIIHKNRSKYLDSLFTKRIESQILLEKTKIDYYLDKYQNNNNFHRDYSIFYNSNSNNNNNSNSNSNTNSNSLRNKSNDKIMKNNSLPNIKNSSTNTNTNLNLSITNKNNDKSNIITKINKNNKNKFLFPKIYKSEISLSPKPNFSNNYVNQKIYNKIFCIKEKNKRNDFYDNIFSYNLKNEIKSYMEKIV